MINRPNYLVVILVVAGCSLFSCNNLPTFNNAGSRLQQISGISSTNTDNWQPKWKTAIDKTKPEKPQRSPTLAFAPKGYGGSPISDGASQKAEDLKSKECFIQNFRETPECFGATLMQTKPEGADFAVQVFHGIYGRTGKWQYLLYHTDTGDRTMWGEADTFRGLTESVCSSVLHDSLPRNAGGNVQ